MKKSILLATIILSITLISVSFVSAGWFSDIFNKDKGVTGDAIVSTCSKYTSCQKFNEIWVNTIYPYSQNYVSFKTDAIVQYSKDGQNKNTYGYDANGGRITANGDLTLDPSRNVVVKSLVLVSPNGSKWKIKVSDSGQLSTEKIISNTTTPVY